MLLWRSPWRLASHSAWGEASKPTKNRTQNPFSDKTPHKKKQEKPQQTPPVSEHPDSSKEKDPPTLHNSTHPTAPSPPCAVAPNAPQTSTNTVSPTNTPRVPTSTRSVWGKVVPIAKRESSKRLVLGEVYVPYNGADPSTVDSQGHATTAQEIERAAHTFLQESRQNQVDVQHNGQAGYGCVVESYLAREGDPSFTPGAWVVGIRVSDDATWQAIEKGHITGISLAGQAQLVPASPLESAPLQQQEEAP